MKLIFSLLLILNFSSVAFANHVLKFEGVPVAMAAKIKQSFPFVFDREVSASEADTVMRYLMATDQFSNIEVHERNNETYVIVASLLRTIKEITVTGNGQFSRSHVIEKLGIDVNQIFSRKEILARADDLQAEYAEQGYINPQIDIDFETPKETEIIIHVKITEGLPSTITEVSFECPNPDIALKAKKVSRYLIGSRLSNPRLKEFETTIKDYFSQNRYLRARMSSPNLSFNRERNKVKINYVIEGPTQYEFIFEGNKYYSQGNLLEAIELEKTIGATTSFAPDLADRIRRTYVNAGFANVQVDFKEVSFPKSYLEQVRFKIVEGLRVRIRTLEVDGQLSRPSKYYSQFLRSNSSDMISYGYYNRKDLENGQKNLTNALRNEGFLQNKVLSLKTSFSKSKEFSDTTLTLEEGPQTLIREIVFTGNKEITAPELLRHMAVHQQSPLIQTDIESSIQGIKDYYHGLGYLEMKLLNEDENLVSFNESNTEAKLNFKIYEGPKIVVTGIEVLGLSMTRPYVVEREVRFKTGDVLTNEKLTDTTYALQKLQLFSSVEIHTDNEGTEIANRKVIITVAEEDAGLFNPGIGLNNDHQLTYRAFSAFGYRNLWGTGRGINARADLWYSTDPTIDYFENRETVAYLEPHLLGSKNDGQINLTREDRFNSYNVGTGAATIEDREQVDLLLQRDIAKHIKLTLYAWEFSKLKDFYRFPPQGQDAVTLYVDVAKIGPSFEFDYRNDIFNPTRGTYSKIQLFYSDPFLGSSDDTRQYVKFFKTDNTITNYQSLNKASTYIWINQLRGGYVGNLRQTTQSYSDPNNGPTAVSGFPSTEAFALGGPNTIRGFGPNEQFPDVYELNPFSTGTITAFKYSVETYYYLLKSELRFPLSKFNGFSIGGAIFYDAGGVITNQPGALNPDSYRHSAGIGIRVNTPVGPVNADIGIKLNRRSRVTAIGTPGDLRTATYSEEAPYAFHLTVGNF